MTSKRGAALPVDDEIGSTESLPRNVLDNLREGCQVIGAGYRYLYLNDTAAAQGRKPKGQLIGKTMSECYPGIETTPMFGILRRCMEERSAEQMENEFTYPDGSKGWFELRFEPVPDGVFIMSMDITEKRRIEDQIRIAQRLESVGRLAGGVAHDFNNLLSVIISYAGFGIESLKESDPLRADLEEIRNAGHRAAALTRQLLAFSRKQVLQPEVVNLNRVLTEMERMMRRIIGEDILLKMRLADDLGNANVDAGQIEQVVMNLAVNARDALPRGGHLTIETFNVELDDEYCRQHIEVKPGPFVVLSVSDNGTGMDEQTKVRIFEPFFTTKELGKGTGLGLSTVFGIVKQSGGSIWVYSEPGKGTTFKIYLPRELSAEETTRHAIQVSIRSTGGETVLVVEDEEAVRNAAKRILVAAGYSVLTAANGEDALAICERHTGNIHLMLTDVVMPRMSGRDLASRVASVRPDLKVLYMSGYTDDAIVEHGVLESGTQLINKPFNTANFTRKVRDVLDSIPLPRPS